MLPNELIAGDTWRFTYTLEDPAAADVLYLHINSAIFQYTSEPAIGADGVFTFVLSKELTRTFAPSRYILSITALKNGERSTMVRNHPCNVEPDPTVASSQSFAARMVEALKNLLEGRVTSSHAAYSAMTFEGRSITQLPPAELHRALKLFEQELEAEEHKRKLASGLRGRRTHIKIAFTKN